MSGRTAAGLKLREKLKSRGRKILKKKKGRNVTTMREMNSGKRLAKNIKKRGRNEGGYRWRNARIEGG